MAEFIQAFRKTLNKEGLLSDDAFDPGGQTVYGLARKFNEEFPGWAIVDDLAKKPGFPKSLVGNEELLRLAEEWYRLHYWNPVKGDGIPSQLIANELFDSMVNIGSASVKFLQLCLNGLNKKETLFPNMKVDGGMGEKTLEGLIKVLQQKNGETILWKSLNGWQVVYYFIGREGFLDLLRYLAECPPPEDRESFEWGWLLNRAFELEDAKTLKG